MSLYYAKLYLHDIGFESVNLKNTLIFGMLRSFKAAACSTIFSLNTEVDKFKKYTHYIAVVLLSLLELATQLARVWVKKENIHSYPIEYVKNRWPSILCRLSISIGSAVLFLYFCHHPYPKAKMEDFLRKFVSFTCETIFLCTTFN